MALWDNSTGYPQWFRVSDIAIRISTSSSTIRIGLLIMSVIPFHINASSFRFRLWVNRRLPDQNSDVLPDFLINLPSS